MQKTVDSGKFPLYNAQVRSDNLCQPNTLDIWGKSCWWMERYINCKFGINAADDRLPRRLTDVPQDPRDPKTKVPLEEMKKTYYKARGCDKNGIPTDATLRRLKIK